MLKIIWVFFSIVIIFSLINGIIIDSNGASMPFGAFLIDIFFLLFVIFNFVVTFFKGFMKGMKFKEVVKENYLWMGSLVFLVAYFLNDIIRYLLK